MKAVFVFPPMSIPTSAPLGIAWLKSYIEKNSDWSVKLIDLNIDFYERIVKKAEDNQIRIYEDEQKDSELCSAIVSAADVFRKGGGEFSDMKKYNPLADRFIFFSEKMKQINDNFLAEFVNGEDNGAEEVLHDYVEKIVAEKPDVIGFSVLFEEQITHSLALAKILKQRVDVPIVFGGATVSYKPENWLKMGSYIDYVIYNEGWLGFIELLKNLYSKKLEDVPNLIYRTKKDGIKINDEGIVESIDDMPMPDFSDFKLKSYFCPEIVVPVTSSMGCYWRKCAFCSHHKSYSMNYRIMSVEKFVEELKLLNKKHGVRHFSLTDEMVAPARLKKIADEIIRQGLDIRYYLMAKPTKEFDKDVLDIAYKSGCRVILWGVESGCQRVLDLMEKGTNVKDVEEVLRLSHEAGIKNFSFAFVGFPGESKEEIQKTIDFMERNKKYIDLQSKGFFRIAEGSPIWEEPEKYGVYDIKFDSKNPLLPSYDYNVRQGVSSEEANKALLDNYAFFMELAKDSPFFGKLRDHMLVFYGRK